MKIFSLICVISISIAAFFVSVAAADGQGQPKILMLTQPICPNCVSVRRVLDDVQNDYLIEVEEFNVRDDFTIVNKYRMTKTPFLVFFNNEGEMIGKREGLVTKEEVMLVFEEAGILLKKK